MRTDLLQALDSMHGKKLLVIGDIVADVYLEGRISRISREAPVIILQQVGETVIPGGAANMIHNAATLGGSVFAVGVVGCDNQGKVLRDTLEGKGVNTEGMICAAERDTITKTRIMAGGQATVRQQVVRIDREPASVLSAASEAKLLDYVTRQIPAMDAVVMSDYAGGTVTPRLREAVIQRCQALDRICVVDSRYDILSFPGITIAKQNETEAATALGCKGFIDERHLEKLGRTLRDKLQVKGLLISRGPDGMSLFEDNGAIYHIPVTNKSEVYDVTGAGDTVVAAMTLAAAGGAALKTAAELANYAAGIVVRKPGTATATPFELRKALGEIGETDQM